MKQKDNREEGRAAHMENSRMRNKFENDFISDHQHNKLHVSLTEHFRAVRPHFPFFSHDFRFFFFSSLCKTNLVWYGVVASIFVCKHKGERRAEASRGTHCSRGWRRGFLRRDWSPQCGRCCVQDGVSRSVRVRDGERDLGTAAHPPPPPRGPLCVLCVPGGCRLSVPSAELFVLFYFLPPSFIRTPAHSWWELPCCFAELR